MHMLGIAILAVAYVMSQFYRTFMAVLTPVLGAELAMSKGEFALATGLWFFTFAAMQFVIGVCLDRYGPRRTTFWIIAPFGVSGGVVFAAAASPAAIIIAMGLIGIGFSPVLMAAMFVFAKRLPPARFAAASSVFIGAGIAGAVLGASPLVAAVDLFGWRNVMLGLTAMTALVSILILKGVEDPEVEPTHPDRQGFGGYLELLRMRQIWPLFPAVFVAYGAMIGTRSLWAGPYLTTMHGADADLIGRVTFWMSIAMVVASFLVVPLNRVFSVKRIAMGLNLAIAAAFACLAFNPALPFAQAAALLITVTLFGSSFVAQAAHGRSFYPPHLVGRGVTLLNAVSIGGAGVLQFATGALVTATANPGAPGLQWSALFAFYAAALVIAIAIYAWSEEPSRSSA
jgi:predicted MFS family arabinose efflux permease